MHETATAASFTSLPGDLAQNTMDFDLFLAEQILHQTFPTDQGTFSEDWMFPTVQADPLDPHLMAGETAYHQTGTFPWLDFPALGGHLFLREQGLSNASANVCHRFQWSGMMYQLDERHAIQRGLRRF